MVAAAERASRAQSLSSESDECTLHVWGLFVGQQGQEDAKLKVLFISAHTLLNPIRVTALTCTAEQECDGRLHCTMKLDARDGAVWAFELLPALLHRLGLPENGDIVSMACLDYEILGWDEFSVQLPPLPDSMTMLWPRFVKRSSNKAADKQSAFSALAGALAKAVSKCQGMPGAAVDWTGDTGSGAADIIDDDVIVRGLLQEEDEAEEELAKPIMPGGSSSSRDPG